MHCHEVFNQFIDLHSLKCFCWWFGIKRFQDIPLEASLQGSSRMNYSSQSPKGFLKSQRPTKHRFHPLWMPTAAQWEIQPTVKSHQHLSAISRIQYKIILEKACKILHQVQSQWLFLPHTIIHSHCQIMFAPCFNNAIQLISYVINSLGIGGLYKIKHPWQN